jgi:murein DD-endopeptidase MepM/ murein hydrolase activator NlpD
MRNHTHIPDFMQPFAVRVRGWYTSPVPSNPRARMPGPLDNLPRPLSEREGRGRGRRRLTALLTAAVVVGVIAVAANTVASGLTVGAGSPVSAAQATDTPPDGSPDQVAGVVASPAAQLGAGTGTPDGIPTGKVVAPAVHDGPDIVPAPPAPPKPPAPDTMTGYRWPIAHARLTLPFGPTPWGGWVVHGKPFHDGIDLATFCGDRIVAAHSGVVLAAGRRYDREIGWVGSLDRYFARLDKKHLWKTLPIVVIIDDGNGYRSIYAHFGKIVVKKGQTVKAGKLLGYEGATGRATGCHLHYGLFSPIERGRFAIESAARKRMKLPVHEIARIDPLLVLPGHPVHQPTPEDAGTQDAP